MKALVFDLDGTLVDTVYAHVLAWQVAFSEVGATVEGWRIHRHIGMGGDLLMETMMREIGLKLPRRKLERADKRHGELMHEYLPRPRPLPGAIELLKDLRQRRIIHGIATSGNPNDMKIALKGLDVGKDVVLVNRSDAAEAKPEPDLFLACQARLGVRPQECYVLGDATWDLLAARRAGMLGIGLLTGGYSESELIAANAYRVFRNPADLHDHLDELGLSPEAPND